MATEKRLIDAKDAVKLLRGKCVAKYPSTFLLGLLASATEIEQMSTVDAVEVVRCKDCKHYFANYGQCRSYSGLIFPAPERFCSSGERRTDET